MDLRPFWKYTLTRFLMSFLNAVVSGTCITLCTSLDIMQEFSSNTLPKTERSRDFHVRAVRDRLSTSCCQCWSGMTV